MSPSEFQNQMTRLQNTWPNFYSTERVKLIWREIPESHSGEWFSRVVDELIGTQKQAPGLTEFRQFISKEREKKWSVEKTLHARDAIEFFKSSYSDEDRRTLCQMITKRMSGAISDREFEQFVHGLDDIAGGPNA